MKIRIEGCTQKELAEHSSYLSLEREYEAEPHGRNSWDIMDDTGDRINVLSPRLGCAHLPCGAKWVEVAE